MDFPEPVIGIAVEPKTQKDMDKLSISNSFFIVNLRFTLVAFYFELTFQTVNNNIQVKLDIIVKIGPVDEDFKEGGLQFIDEVKGGNIPKEFIPKTTGQSQLGGMNHQPKLPSVNPTDNRPIHHFSLQLCCTNGTYHEAGSCDPGRKHG